MTSVVWIAGCCCAGPASPVSAEEKWTDVTGALMASLEREGIEPGWPGGCSGVVADRLTGDVCVKAIGAGIWRSSDRGKSWTRVDGGIISGRDETGWATSVDQNNPRRVATFSLDGMAGWAPRGDGWNPFTSLGRNWDFGSVNWMEDDPSLIIAARHETDPPGEVWLSVDGGEKWSKLSIRLDKDRDNVSMVGAMGDGSLIYGNGDGIHRSTDRGENWAKVSAVNPQTRVPVQFGGVQYLGTRAGLLVSRDHGASWRTQGAEVDIWQGPFFGRDGKEMVVVGKAGIFKSLDAGEGWERVADLKEKEEGFLFIVNWFGCYAWDPVNDILYASSMGNPVYAIELE